MSGRRCDSPSEPRDPRPTSVLKAVRDGILIQSYNGQQETYRCIVCARCMSGAVPAQSHVEGFPHEKALRNYKNSSNSSYDNEDDYSDESDPDGYDLPTSFGRKQNYGSKSRFKADPVQRAMKRGIVVEEKSGSQTFLACKVCQIKCTGQTSMDQHLIGEPHCKKQKRMELDKELPEPKKSADTSCSSASGGKPKRHNYDECSSTDNLLDWAIDDGTVVLREGSTLYLTCTVCRSSCSGEAPMIQHLQGVNHQKKLRATWEV